MLIFSFFYNDRIQKCKAETQKCIHCKQEWHEMLLCSVYRKKQSEHKRAVLQNTRGLYADVLKSTSSVNPFDNLSLLEGNEPLPNLAPLNGVKKLYTTRVPNKKTIKKMLKLHPKRQLDVPTTRPHANPRAPNPPVTLAPIYVPVTLPIPAIWRSLANPDLSAGHPSQA